MNISPRKCFRQVFCILSKVMFWSSVRPKSLNIIRPRNNSSPTGNLVIRSKSYCRTCQEIFPFPIISPQLIHSKFRVVSKMDFQEWHSVWYIKAFPFIKLGLLSFHIASWIWTLYLSLMFQKKNPTTSPKFYQVPRIHYSFPVWTLFC